MDTHHKILVLGAGKVASPIVKYFLKKNYLVTLASEHLYQAELIIDNHPNGTPLEWHADDIHKLDTLVKSHEVAVSLLPYALHTLVAQCCIRCKKKHGYYLLRATRHARTAF